MLNIIPLLLLVFFINLIESKYFPIIKQHSKFMNSDKIIMELVSTSVLNFMPWLELHHVVIMKDKSIEKGSGVYTVDFSPINQAHPKTLLKLVCGKFVPAEIRVRWIPLKELTEKELKNNVLCADLNCFSAKPRNIRFTLNKNNYKINGKRSYLIEKLIREIEDEWGYSMNLYSRNCRHFSYYVRKTIPLKLNHLSL